MPHKKPIVKPPPSAVSGAASAARECNDQDDNDYDDDEYDAAPAPVSAKLVHASSSADLDLKAVKAAASSSPSTWGAQKVAAPEPPKPPPPPPPAPARSAGYTSIYALPSRAVLAGLGGVAPPRAPVGHDKINPEVAPATDADALQLAAGASYILSRGPDGVEELKRWIRVAEGQPWLQRIHIHGAVANDWPNEVKLVLTHPDVQCDINAIDQNGYSPLHMAVVWGRPSMAVLLLSLGADISVRTVDENESTPSGMARLRLSKLLRPALDGHEDISHMRHEGRELVDLLDAVEKHPGNSGGGAGSKYLLWAVEHGAANRHVQRHSPKLIANAQRHKLALLRELVGKGRATVRSVAEQVAWDAARAKAARAAAAAASGPPETLEAAMKAGGLLKENPTVMMRQVTKLLGCASLADLLEVSREDIAALDEIDPSERRALWHFVSMQQEKQQQAPVAATAAAAGKAEGGGKAKKAAAGGGKVAKAGKGGGDLAALLAEGVGDKKSKTAKPKAEPKAAPKAAPAAPAVAAAPAAAAKAPAAASAADCFAASSAAGVGGGSKKGAAEGGGGPEDYTRWWPDQPSVLNFVFRSDLPTDAFTLIAKALYN